MLNFAQKLLILLGKNLKFSQNLSKVSKKNSKIQIYFFTKLEFSGENQNFLKINYFWPKHEFVFQKIAKNWQFLSQNISKILHFSQKKKKKKIQKSLNLT